MLAGEEPEVGPARDLRPVGRERHLLALPLAIRGDEAVAPFVLPVLRIVADLSVNDHSSSSGIGTRKPATFSASASKLSSSSGMSSISRARKIVASPCSLYVG